MSKEIEKESGNPVEESRRNFLKTAGRIAVYTPPAMLIMARPSYATYQKTGGYQHTYTHWRHRRISRASLYRFFGHFFR